MNWTRLLAGALVLAGCGDDGGDTRGDTQVITSVTMTNPTGVTNTMSGSETSGLTGGLEESGSGTASVSSTIEPTTAETTNETSAGPTTVPPGTTTTGGLDDTGTDVSTGDDTTGEPMKFDLMPFPDIDPPVCLQCALTIASQQSGTLAIAGQAVFATAQLQGQIVYALGTWGAGRFIAAADSSLPFNEVTDCPLSEWLAANGGVQPKILYFGWGPSDGPKQWNVPSDPAGVHLPPQYIGNPGQLLADYDIVLYLEGSGQFGMDQPSDQEMTTLLDYLSMGGGVYISSEFFGYLNNMDLMSVNRLLTPLGITAQATNLNWGNVDGNIDFECFPEPQ
jgi:hypothetical protein